jgi:SnoaL-like domain
MVERHDQAGGSAQAQTQRAHPYRTAWQTRDLEVWGQALAADVVLYSPILRTPFRGREAAIELFGVLFEKLGEVEITDELAEGDSRVFFWRARVGARTIEGVDLVRKEPGGKITEIKVMIRPLVDIATFAGAIGPQLAAKRGRLRGPLARFLNAPLRSIFALIDTIASRLTQRR